MVELDFWDERRGATIARVPARDPAAVPGSGDVVYIPDADQSGVYLHIRVNSRQFYYSQEGDLVTIRLLCEAL
jgi:hypothetical protein